MPIRLPADAYGFADRAFVESDDDSPVEETSSAPVFFMISLARLISSEVLQ